MSGAATPPPPVQGIGGGKAPMSALGKAGVVAGVAAVLGVLYWMGSGPGGGRTGAEDVGASGGAAGAMRQIMLPPPEPPAPPPQATSIALAPAPAFAPPPRRPVRQAEKQKAAPIMAFEDRAEGPARADAAAASARNGDGGPAEDELGERLRATRTEAVRARRLRDRDLVLTMGAMIPCTRKTPINTQLPGFVLCETPEAVQGTSGNVDVLPAKTKIVGPIQRAVMHGTDRAFILWTRLETPDGVTVELASPGTDALGRSGVPVEVHTNFWARFGGAVMLSFIDAGLQAAAIAASNAAQAGGDGQRLNFFQLQSGGRGAAARALDATVNIPPFGTAPQGEAEAVFVARDIDFTSVYRLRRVGR